ncbi:predicted protein [Botrytis cinerea T4]|uniref:Uncharacterized protein n=1 Tax=Botryotinia fuckeliana (strain T4) TaxID=999810 RepID=G2XTA7_BOTF4|nr:predicted protein [Botrytis cinerea T4]
MQAEKARCYVVGTPPGGESGRAAEWVNQHHVMIGHHQVERRLSNLTARNCNEKKREHVL